MEITQITHQNLSMFEEILPSYKRSFPPVLLGCIENDTAAATAAMDVTEDGCSLSWLWVAPEFRGHGIGNLLIDKVCEIAAARPAHRLTVTYPAEESWSAIMDYMLSVRGFWVMIHTYPQYRITKEQLLASPLLKVTGANPDSRIVSLSQLERFRLQELLTQCRLQNNYPVSDADYDQIDATRSMALVQNGHVQGLVLIRPLEEKDILCLDLFYLATSDPRLGILLLKQTALALLQHPAGLKEVRFTCMSDISVRICKRLMGEQPVFWREFCHGTLLTEFYRTMRRSRYE